MDSLRLLRWAILIDTVNLSEQHKKATPKDKDMLEKIEIALGLDHDDEVRNDRKTLHQKISQAKSDTSKFTGYQKLRKDLKVSWILYNPNGIFQYNFEMQDYSYLFF